MLRAAASVVRLTLAVVRSVALETFAMSVSVPAFTTRIQLATARVAERLAAPPAIPEGAEVVTAPELAALRAAVEGLESLGLIIAIPPAPAPGVGEVVDDGAVVPAAQPGQ